MVKIPYTLNVIVQLALIGWGFFFGGGVCNILTMYVHLSFLKLGLCPLDAKSVGRLIGLFLWRFICRSQWNSIRNIQALIHGVLMCSCSHTMTQSLTMLSSDEPLVDL